MDVDYSCFYYAYLQATALLVSSASGGVIGPDGHVHHDHHHGGHPSHAKIHHQGKPDFHNGIHCVDVSTFTDVLYKNETRTKCEVDFVKDCRKLTKKVAHLFLN